MEDRDPLPITTPPAKDQLINHDDKTYTTVQEGKAHILVPPNARTSVNPNAKAKADEEQRVFYNPIQQFNRDLSVLAIKAYGGDLCRRKTAGREVRKRKEEEKRQRKKQNKAAQSRPTETETSNGASESAAMSTEASSKKRKRTDDDDAEESEGQVRKALKDGHTQPVHDTNASTEPPDVDQKSWQPSFRILDALSATGLRALRYATEIPTATAIVANDRDRQATAAVALNVQHNGLTSKISTSTGDAMGHMYAAAFPPTHSHGPNHISGKYDVIDLDPYGTAAPFIDAALQALNDEGMLCVTCTDSGVFASCGYSEKTFSLYGGMPIKGTHAHEGGLRLILHSVATSAAKYSLAIEPLLSLSIDFYARLFIRVRKSPADVKFLAGKTMLVYECDVGCGAWSTQFLGRHQRHGKGEASWKYHIATAPTSDKLCEHCGSKMHLAGPMWGGLLHNAAFVEKILDDVESVDKEVYQTLPRIEGMLDTALSELLVNREALEVDPATTFAESHNHNADANPAGARSDPLIPPTPPHIIDHHPFYFLPSVLCKVIKAVAPPENAIKGALRRLGYTVTRSHAKAGSLKTNAPFAVIWEVLREWVRQRQPVKREHLREGGPGEKILSRTRVAPPDAEADAGVDGDADAVTPEITVNGGTPVTKTPPRPAPGKELDVGMLKIVFDEKLGREKPGTKRLVRYQQNPRENWGPMARAKGHA